MSAPALASSPTFAGPRLLVVCGPPRSGTTWLQRELCKMPSTYPFLPECTYITQQILLFKTTVHYGEKKRTEAYFGDRMAIQNYFRLNIKRLLLLVKNLNPQKNAKLLILKDPELCHCLDALDSVLPPHKLVIIVRDPRDVLASMKEVAGRRVEPWEIHEASQTIANYYYSIGNFFGGKQPNAILVRYEELVTDPSKMASLIEFAGGHPGHQRSMSSEVEVVKAIAATDPFFSDLYLRPTTAARIGNFRSILSRREIDFFESSYFGIMREWNYQPVSLKVRALSFFSKSVKNLLQHSSAR